MKFNCRVKDEDHIVVAVNSATNLGNNISLMAVEKNVSIGDLGRFVMNNHKNTNDAILDVIHGRKALRFSEIMRLCTILQCNIEDLTK